MAQVLVEPMARLVNQLSRLPGVGAKSAQRLAYHIIDMGEGEVRELAEAIFYAKKRTHFCSQCGNLTDGDPCAICRDDRRDRSWVCVVKDPRDIMAMERVRDYKGVYHVLHGTISPMDGVGPDQLSIKPLIERIATGEVREVILATNPDIEGEATAVYIARLIKPLGVKATRIAHGIPVGGDLEYTDGVTLSRALAGRQEM